MSRKRKLSLLALLSLVIFGAVTQMRLSAVHNAAPTKSKNICLSLRVSEQTFTPVNSTKHLLIAAYMERRMTEAAVRIISVYMRNSSVELFCVFCCEHNLSSALPAKILIHSDHFGFPYATTDILCQIPSLCSPSHVTLLTHAGASVEVGQPFLAISNLGSSQKEEEPQLNFTVCISNLFGDYNNVLQYTQTLEMYRLLGVGRVVVYNTSNGPDLERLLLSYIQEGFVDIIPWPIDHYITPSYSWTPQMGGEMHYFGQLATLNDCVYRYMYRSRYVLLNDIDEIIVPYQHTSLSSAVSMLQGQNPKAGVFLVENHIFPKIHFEPSGKFHLPRWEGVPGVNIMEHIYREEPDRTIYHPYKMIVRPRAVEQTSVHSVLRRFAEEMKVPPEVLRIVHVRVPLRSELTLQELHEDTRLWDYEKELVPNVDKALRRAGFLK